MFKWIAISTTLAGGLFAGVLGVAGAANANYDAPDYSPVPGQYDAPDYSPVPGQYDAPYYGQYDPSYYGPVPGRYDYDARCNMPANGSILIGPEGVAFGLPGGGVATVSPLPPVRCR
jgi:hypothetical protein